MGRPPQIMYVVNAILEHRDAFEPKAKSETAHLGRIVSCLSKHVLFERPEAHDLAPVD